MGERRPPTKMPRQGLGATTGALVAMEKKLQRSPTRRGCNDALDCLRYAKVYMRQSMTIIARLNSADTPPTE